MSLTTSFPLANLPANVLASAIPGSADHVTIAKTSLTKLARNDFSVLAATHAHWRDLLALTSTMRTFNSSIAFREAWTDCMNLHKPRDFRFKEGSSAIERVGSVTIITAQFHFTNGLEPSGRCLGYLTIAPETSVASQALEYKIFALSTILESIDGYGDPDVYSPQFHSDPTQNNRSLPSECQSSNGPPNGDSFDALVVGLGPSGLCNVARLRALGLNAIGCDKIPEVGLNWTDRYDTLKLHTPKMQNSLPFNFKPPKEAPYYLAAKDIKRYYQTFVDEFKLSESLWLSTTVKHASFNQQTSSWTITLIQSGQERVVSSRHLVFCLGVTGRIPVQLTLPGRDIFTGTAIHAVDYVNAKGWAGKRGVVIGTANTGHDVAEDMANAGMHVTMVQRSRTPVLNVPKLHIHRVYHDNVDVTETDKGFHSRPLAIERIIVKAFFRDLMHEDADKFDKLEARGFRVDREADLIQILYERAGRHYMDVGVSQMVIDGKINVKSGSALTEYTPQGLKFADGTEIPADFIVFATGYATDMKLSASRLLDPEVADKLDESWLLDEEGNPRGSWKPIGHPNIWFCPGDISHTRYFSRFVALQVKAEVEGRPLIPYQKQSLS